MPAFQPIGEQARWRTIYDLLHKLPVDGVLTYVEMGEALELDPVKDRHTLQMASRRALRELLEVDRRACEPVRNVGYRVVQPNEHLVLAESRDRRARVQIREGFAVATNVDLSEVDPNVRKALMTLAEAFSQQLEINRRVEAKQRRHDDAIALLTRKVKELESKHEAG